MIQSIEKFYNWISEGGLLIIFNFELLNLNIVMIENNQTIYSPVENYQ